jgi:uncharacterized protein YdeI (YjbR/CyaY-like superfamily)
MFLKPTRSRYSMPDFIRDALNEGGLTAVYNERPPYQRNDYIGWIMRAKREETQQKRLKQLLKELDGGKQYMNMKWT